MARARGRDAVIPRVVITGALASLGFALWAAAAGLLPQADRAKWDLGAGSVAIEMADLAGELPDRADTLDLWSYRGAAPKIPAFAEGSVHIAARVPADGLLTLRFGADGVGTPLQPTRAAGPPPKSAGLPARPDGGVSHGGGAPVGHGQPERGSTLLVDRANGRISGKNLRCDPASAPASDTFVLDVEARGGALAVSVDGKPAARCEGRWGAGALVIGSGVRRVQVSEVTVAPAGGAPFSGGIGGAARSVALGVGIALVFAGLAWRFVRPSRGLALVLVPLWALAPLARMDLRGVLDGLRLVDLPTALGPLVLVGVPATALLVAWRGATAATLRAAAQRGLAPVAALVPVVGIAAAVGRAHDAPGWLVLAALGAPTAALAWINTHPFARRVAASYALVAALALGAEAGVRLTALDRTWSLTEGARRAGEEFRELLEIRRYRAYPDEGFPVRPPERDPTRKRIVALGGSSTGGAYQMDDLGLFWPARLAERLGAGWEVVNQAVGGWNTLHVALYLESQAERLGADVYVLYVGHNDLLALSDVPYRQLYEAWRTPSPAVRAVADTLGRVRLYVGFKRGLLTLRGTRAGAAVPVPDARDNLSAILTIAKAHQARVLLVTEGLNPSGVPMRPYGEMQRVLAEQTGNVYLDAAAAFDATADPDLFLDDCHLSVPGHARLAGWVHDALQQAGWLDG